MLNNLERFNLTSFPEVMLQLQYQQQVHDDLYHRDIARLSTLEKLKHYHIHFSKYLAAFFDCEQGEAYVTAGVKMVDALVIALAAANCLRLDLGKRLTAKHRGIACHCSTVTCFSQALVAKQSLEILATTKSDWLGLALVGPIGRLAKALDAVDHLESFNSREEAASAILDIVEQLLIASGDIALDVERAIVDCRAAIRQRSLFGDHALMTGSFVTERRPAKITIQKATLEIEQELGGRPWFVSANAGHANDRPAIFVTIKPVGKAIEKIFRDGRHGFPVIVQVHDRTRRQAPRREAPKVVCG